MSTPQNQVARLITPWNPSRRAVKRVLNPLPVPDHCHLCGGACAIVNNTVIYGREYGEWPWAVRCEKCNAYVGLHPFTDIPLGTLANAPMRAARKVAKAWFNPLWEVGPMTRTEAYAWLAQAMGIANVEECHIGWFDIAQCQAVVAAVKARLT